MLQKTLTCEGHANLHKVTFGYRSPQGALYGNQAP